MHKYMCWRVVTCTVYTVKVKHRLHVSDRVRNIPLLYGYPVGCDGNLLTSHSPLVLSML